MCDLKFPCPADLVQRPNKSVTAGIGSLSSGRKAVSSRSLPCLNFLLPTLTKPHGSRSLFPAIASFLQRVQFARLVLATIADEIIARRCPIGTLVATRQQAAFTPASTNITFANLPHPSFPPGQNDSFKPLCARFARAEP